MQIIITMLLEKHVQGVSESLLYICLLLHITVPYYLPQE